ncbi:uncharacterized protein plekho2 [Leuresthes tenuis]|uniref:uncharacterized protein plekho2 n=1 Tax=Leuresthes tenuis TaxID=355514 RepID=UPI003B50387C
MEDGTKEDPAQYKEPRFLSKAGWVKKAHGRVLASYKDRYIHVEKTEIVVYENEDLQNCLERHDLENYDKCHELKSPFKRKHRLILIRSPKSGNKVHDVKFQAQTAEEKEAWIKAFSDAMNRAKNKVFDEVKVDESSNLEHVTRSRPKGNRNRRPPTRIHMKEVAVVSSDGILRLDLDLEDAVMPNGTNLTNVDGTEPSKEATDLTPRPNTNEAAEKQLVSSAEEEPQTEPDASPQKKVIKPPMPPSKEAKPCPAAEDELDNNDVPEKKVLKAPMPPSKGAKPCVSPVHETTEDQKPDAKKKTGPPPTPPNKPSSSSSLSNLAEASQSTPSSHPPTPPSKDKKPTHPAVEPDKQVKGTTEENKEKEEDSGMETTGTANERDETDQLIFEENVSRFRNDKPESPNAEGKVSDEESLENVNCGIKKTSDSQPQEPTEPQRKCPSPPLTSKKSPEKLVQPDTQDKENCSAITHLKEGWDSTASDTTGSSLQAQEVPAQSEVPSVVVSLEDPLTDSLSLLHRLSGEKKKKAEEKSVDSGQHSDDESEGSGSEDTLAASTAALRGSHAGLDVLDVTEDKIQTSVNLRPAAKLQAGPKVFQCRRSEPSHKPLRPSAKPRSASIGDLLSEPTGCFQLEQPSRAENRSTPVPIENVMKLETEVALEMEKTSELLSQAQGESFGEGLPEDLLAKAMEKLKKANHVLMEVKKLKLTSSSRNRMSW